MLYWVELEAVLLSVQQSTCTILSMLKQRRVPNNSKKESLGHRREILGMPVELTTLQQIKYRINIYYYISQ